MSVKILVAYASKTGTTAKAAALLCERLRALGADCDMGEITGKAPDLSGYDAVCVGGFIRMGMLAKQSRAFAAQNAAELMARPLGLFCCRGGSEELSGVLDKSVDPALVKHAKALGSFGAELNMDKLKGIDRFVAKMVAKSDMGSTMKANGVDEAAIDEFAQAMVKPE